MPNGPYVGDCAVALGRLARDSAAAEIAICLLDRLKWRLECVGTGLDVVLPAADNTHRQFVQGVKDEVGKILGVLPNDTTRTSRRPWPRRSATGATNWTSC